MFGALPPNLYENSWRKDDDDTSTLRTRPYSTIGTITLDRAGSRGSSVRRSSLVALSHIVNHDPHALDELAHVYHGENRASLESSTPSSNELVDKRRISHLSSELGAPRLSGEGSDAGSGFDVSSPPNETVVTSASSRRSSSDRHIARAAKLARLLGTTKGQVLTSILDDLEDEVADDSDVSDDERRAVLEEIDNLRATTTGPRTRPQSRAL